LTLTINRIIIYFDLLVKLILQHFQLSCRIDIRFSPFLGPEAYPVLQPQTDLL
jgi:hypothetical protein